jgi:DNA-binding NtrC family response regulator
MPWPLEVLVATADAGTRRSLADLLGKGGLSPVICSTVSQAHEILIRQPICLVFSDYRLPDGDFRDVLNEVKRSSSSVPVIVTNRIGDDWDEYLNVLRCGAFDYIDCSWPRCEVQRIVARALNTVCSFASQPPAKTQEDLRENHESSGNGRALSGTRF